MLIIRVLAPLAKLTVYNWSKTVCVCVNQGGTNHNHYKQITALTALVINIVPK